MRIHQEMDVSHTPGPAGGGSTLGTCCLCQAPAGCPVPDNAVVLQAGCSRGAKRLCSAVLSQPAPAPCQWQWHRSPAYPEVPAVAVDVPTRKREISSCGSFSLWT